MSKALVGCACSRNHEQHPFFELVPADHEVHQIVEQRVEHAKEARARRLLAGECLHDVVRRRPEMPLDLFGDVFGTGEVNTFLAVKVILEGGKVDARLVREHPRRCAVETMGAEDLESGRNDFCARLIPARVAAFGWAPLLRWAAGNGFGVWHAQTFIAANIYQTIYMFQEVDFLTARVKAQRAAGPIRRSNGSLRSRFSTASDTDRMSDNGGSHSHRSMVIANQPRHRERHEHDVRKAGSVASKASNYATNRLSVGSRLSCVQTAHRR